MRNIDVVQVSFMRPLIDFLDQSGADTGLLLQRSGLDRFNLDRLTAYVPMAAAGRFFEEVARTQTGPRLPAEVYQRYTINRMGDWSAYVYEAPDILAACKNGCLPEARTFSRECMVLTVSGGEALLFDTLAMPPGLARDWAEDLLLAMMVDGFRVFMGKDWVPPQTFTRVEDTTGIEEFLGDGALIDRNPGGFGVGFHSSILGRRAVLKRQSDADETDKPHMPLSLVARLESIIDAGDPGNRVTLQWTADLLGMSERGLQRDLQKEGSRFIDVMDAWRMKSALLHLQNNRLSIAEIAELLHYSHSSNFIRAFQRWTGTTPTKFRQDGAGAPD